MNPNKIFSILLTHQCNLHCDYCYVNAENSPAYQENGLSLIQWQSVLKEGRSLGYSSLHILGGEPFLSPLLPDLCQMAVKMGYQLLIATNGTAFHDSDRAWLVLLRESLQISFTINEIESSWAKLAPIKKSWLDFFAKNHIITTIVTCLTTKNIAHYKTFLEIFTVKGKNSWGFFGINIQPINNGMGPK